MSQSTDDRLGKIKFRLSGRPLIWHFSHVNVGPEDVTKVFL